MYLLNPLFIRWYLFYFNASFWYSLLYNSNNPVYRKQTWHRLMCNSMFTLHLCPCCQRYAREDIRLLAAYYAWTLPGFQSSWTTLLLLSISQMETSVLCMKNAMNCRSSRLLKKNPTSLPLESPPSRTEVWSCQGVGMLAADALLSCSWQEQNSDWPILNFLERWWLRRLWPVCSLKMMLNNWNPYLGNPQWKCGHPSETGTCTSECGGRILCNRYKRYRMKC